LKVRPLFLTTVAAALTLATVTFAACTGGSSPASTPASSGTGGMGGMGGMGGTSGMNGANGTSAPAGNITVSLANWSVKPAVTSTKAGTVTFRALHAMDHSGGTETAGQIHDLDVARKNADGSFTQVGKVADIKMGQSKDLTLNLTAGEYELQCNVVEQVNGKLTSHYALGMHTAFTVTN